MLDELFKASGSPVSRLHLYKTVWGYSRLPRGRAVDFTMLRLRKKLEACGEDPGLLITVRARGFRLVGAEPMDPPAAAAAPAAAPAAEDNAPIAPAWAVQMDLSLIHI